MAGSLQCFECVIWSEIGAKCARHGVAGDEEKRRAHAVEAMRQLGLGQRRN